MEALPPEATRVLLLMTPGGEDTDTDSAKLASITQKLGEAAERAVLVHTLSTLKIIFTKLIIQTKNHQNPTNLFQFRFCFLNSTGSR